MDVIFETKKGESFTIEIGYFDTVFEIKEKIEKYKGIPISTQTLVFNGKVLEDFGNVESCAILHNSHIHLNVVAPPEDNPKSPENLKLKAPDHNDDNERYHHLLQSFNNNNNSSNNNGSTKIHVVLKLLSKSRNTMNVEVDFNDSVEQLKKKIYNLEGFPVHRTSLYVNKNIEMQDRRQLRDYELKDGIEIDVVVKPSNAPTLSGKTNTMSTTGAKKFNVTVASMCGTKKVVIEVNPKDKVQVLRKVLELMEESFQLPKEEYFFIYRQSVMEEKETFQWHNYRQGDEIEIFKGCVTGGT